MEASFRYILLMVAYYESVLQGVVEVMLVVMTPQAELLPAHAGIPIKLVFHL